MILNHVIITLHFYITLSRGGHVSKLRDYLQLSHQFCLLGILFFPIFANIIWFNSSSSTQAKNRQNMILHTKSDCDSFKVNFTSLYLDSKAISTAQPFISLICCAFEYNISLKFLIQNKFSIQNK